MQNIVAGSHHSHLRFSLPCDIMHVGNNNNHKYVNNNNHNYLNDNRNYVAVFLKLICCIQH